jgi:hypothetical protein
MTRRSLHCLLAAAFVLTVMPLSAQDIVFKSKLGKATLLELYSSEGCSSCPPAEAWVSDLKNVPGLWSELFPVAFHVDYWDGHGWKDRFARPEYTQRQKNYAAQLNQQSVYTPEFIVNGHEWSDWFHSEDKIPAQIDTQGHLTVSCINGGKNVSAVYSPPASSGATMYVLNVALLGMDIVSDVQHGENGGQQLTHDFIVLDFSSHLMDGGPISQSGHAQLKPAIGDTPAAIVAWISAPDGSILQMTGGWLNPTPSK